MYSFEYDPLDRLADSRHYLNASPSNSFEEKNISYDLNGNILTLTRVGESGDENEVTYSYSGNQLTSSIYDLNGNITYDVTSGLTMEWNHLDLIKKVSNNSGVLINYTYLSDGTKVRSVDASGEGLEYRGSLTFRRSSDGTLTPESIAFPGGRFIAMQVADGSIQMVPNYHIADHLGSIRTIIDGSTGQVIETNDYYDYYAFGGRWNRSGSLVDQSHRYRFNGTKMGMKETDMPSIVLTKDEHRQFTAAWNKAIGRRGTSNAINTETADYDIILEKARTIYKDYPELLKVIEQTFK